MTDTPTSPDSPDPTQPQLQPRPLHLAAEPAQLAAYLKNAATSDTPATFADFITAMTMTDFSDVYEIRGILESQVQVLGAAFQYLMLEGEWRSLPMALRSQKMMIETIDTMNGYPSAAYYRSLQDAVRQKNNA